MQLQKMRKETAMPNETLYAYRPVPCPSYDIEGLEGWLCDMSAHGLHLSSDGFFASFGIFERDSEKRYLYRLEAAPSRRKRSMEDASPDMEVCSVSAELGWEYTAQYGEFYIFRTAHTFTRELNTDPAVQAIALNNLVKRMRSHLLWTLGEIVFWIWYFTRGVYFLYMSTMGVIYTVFITLLLLLLGVRSASRLIHLYRLRAKLSRGIMLDHTKNWRAHAARNYVIRAAITVSVITAVLVSMGKLGDIILNEGYIPLEEYKETPPFITMTDMYPGAGFEREEFIIPNEMKKWSTLITPVNYDWQEYGSFTFDNGEKLCGSLHIYYHETVAPWIAHRIAKEYSVQGQNKNRKTYEPLPINLPFDGYAAAYRGNLHTPCLILQKNNTVLWIQFYPYGENRMEFDKWAFIFLESLS